MSVDDELVNRLADALIAPEREPDPARIATLRAAAERMTVGPEPTVVGHRRSRRAVALIGIAAAVVVLMAIVGIAVARGDDPSDRLAGGVVEFESTLRAPDGTASAEVRGVRNGFGRIVELRSDQLPILPKGDYYEVWFVGPGDTATAPNRISAGTFHPDEQGRTDIALFAAVDPANHPDVTVTAEHGDGDPDPSNTVVLRAPIAVIR